MFAKVVGVLAIIAGAIFCALGWGSYQLNMAGAIGPSAIQVSQLANQATVTILGGIGLMVFGMSLSVIELLSEIRDNTKQD